MKNKFLIFLLFVGFLCNAQLNGYKYAYIDFGEDPDKYNVIDVLPKNISLPSNTKLETLPLTEQIKEISKYVVLIKVK
jgi:hypothetical protein